MGTHERARTLSRRTFIARSAAAGAGLLAAPSAIGLAGCAQAAVASPPPPPNVWAPVSVAELEPFVPRWVEFPIVNLPIEGGEGGEGSGASGSAGGTGSGGGDAASESTGSAVSRPPVEPARPVESPADAAGPGTGGAWLVKGSDGTVTAFAPWCTHLQCLYQWDTAESDFHCRCHEGRYNLAGVPIAGPPPRPLWTLETRATTDPGVIEIGWFRSA